MRLVKKKANGEVYAMKSMIKEAMVRKNQVGHVRAERDVLAVADNPWIVTLHYSFQDEHVSSPPSLPPPSLQPSSPGCWGPSL